jgi:two-component system nitrogen regulation sensor histidine kinase GlnL
MAVLLDSAPAAIFAFAPDGRLALANQAAQTLLGAPRHALSGRRADELFGPGTQACLLVQRVLSQNVAVAETEAAVSGLGHGLGMCAIAAAWAQDQSALLVTVTPKGRRRSAGERRAAPPVARTLAHEVRNPLAGIRGAAQLIGQGAGAETRALVDLICEEVDRIRRLTDRIDELDSLPPPKLSAMNIHQALERVTPLARQSFPGLVIQCDYDPSLPPVSGDLDQLIQVFLNLLKNAAEAVARTPNGRIRLATRYRTGARLRADRAPAAQALLEVIVSDNGPGIPSAIMERLFEPFATSKPNGAGLGLAVAGRIVEAHGGRIDVESAPGATAFRVCLPLEPQDAHRAAVHE